MNQFERKRNRIKRVVDEFLSYENITIDQLSTILEIPPSTIQRDLNDFKYIQMIYGHKAKEKLIQISTKLKQNKEQGLIRGGIISTTNNEAVRDENGKFIGNRKK